MPVRANHHHSYFVISPYLSRLNQLVQSPDIARGRSTLPSHKCLIAMRADSFLFPLDGPEILFPFQIITTHSTALSTHSVKQQPSEKYQSNYSNDSDDGIVFEKLYARTDSKQNQE